MTTILSMMMPYNLRSIKIANGQLKIIVIIKVMRKVYFIRDFFTHPALSLGIIVDKRHPFMKSFYNFTKFMIGGLVRRLA